MAYLNTLLVVHIITRKFLYVNDTLLVLCTMFNIIYEFFEYMYI